VELLKLPATIENGHCQLLIYKNKDYFANTKKEKNE
jgi:hypothetical protein